MGATGRKLTKAFVFQTYEIVGDPQVLRRKGTDSTYTLLPGVILDPEMGRVDKYDLLFTLYFGYPPEQKVTAAYLLRVLFNGGEPGSSRVTSTAVGTTSRLSAQEYLGQHYYLDGRTLIRKSDGMSRTYTDGVKLSKQKVYIGPGLPPLEWSTVFNYFKQNAPLQHSTD